MLIIYLLLLVVHSLLVTRYNEFMNIFAIINLINRLKAVFGLWETYNWRTKAQSGTYVLRDFTNMGADIAYSLSRFEMVSHTEILRLAVVIDTWLGWGFLRVQKKVVIKCTVNKSLYLIYNRTCSLILKRKQYFC